MTESATQFPNRTNSATAVKPIRALHLIHSVCHGGIESAMLNWVTAFPAYTSIVPFVASLHGDRGLDGALLRAAERVGVPEVHKIGWHRGKPFLRAAKEIAALVEKLNIDVVHTHAYYGDVLGALLKRYSKVKVVATVYVWEKYELHRQIMQAMDWTALHFVDKVTAHCEETRRRTVKLGFREKDIPLLITGFNTSVPVPGPEARAELRREAGLAEDEILLVNVARIHPEKAHDQLIQSFAQIHQRHPKTKLWISGVGYPHLEKSLHELRDSLGLKEAVQFVGHKPDLYPMLHAADIMTHSSHAEGVPIALLYGMAAGLPIVVSDVGGVYEVIHQGKTGIRVKENDIAGFAQAVNGLIEDGDRRRHLGRAARSFLETEYSMEVACRRVEAVYREVLGQ
ncbi:MAG: glycosyltransferase [Bryobacter sp.]|nr:glycosyltransferase [Bryobacter sp.]